MVPYQNVSSSEVSTICHHYIHKMMTNWSYNYVFKRLILYSEKKCPPIDGSEKKPNSPVHHWLMLCASVEALNVKG